MLTAGFSVELTWHWAVLLLSRKTRSNRKPIAVIHQVTNNLIPTKTYYRQGLINLVQKRRIRLIKPINLEGLQTRRCVPSFSTSLAACLPIYRSAQLAVSDEDHGQTNSRTGDSPTVRNEAIDRALLFPCSRSISWAASRLGSILNC
jgi:hypothetical protein